MRGIFFPGFDVEESIDDLFDRIEDALDADRILVAFDEERGFPTRMQVDPSIIITGAHLDDRYGFSVSDFREGPCDAR